MKALFAPLFLIFLVACTTPVTPQTASERLAAAEISYQTAVQTLNQLTDAGVIKPGTDTAKRVVAAAQAANRSSPPLLR